MVGLVAVQGAPLAESPVASPSHFCFFSLVELWARMMLWMKAQFDAWAFWTLFRSQSTMGFSLSITHQPPGLCTMLGCSQAAHCWQRSLWLLQFSSQGPPSFPSITINSEHLTHFLLLHNLNYYHGNTGTVPAQTQFWYWEALPIMSLVNFIYNSTKRSLLCSFPLYNFTLLPLWEVYTISMLYGHP